MAYTIKISYTAGKSDFINQLVDSISRIFYPGHSYLDNPNFPDAGFNKNVTGFGSGMTADAFINSSCAHPGVIAHLKQAAANGSVEFTLDDADKAAYYVELGTALADEGYAIVVKNGEKQIFPVVASAVEDESHAGTV